MWVSVVRGDTEAAAIPTSLDAGAIEGATTDGAADLSVGDKPDVTDFGAIGSSGRCALLSVRLPKSVASFLYCCYVRKSFASSSVP